MSCRTWFTLTACQSLKNKNKKNNKKSTFPPKKCGNLEISSCLLQKNLDISEFKKSKSCQKGVLRFDILSLISHLFYKTHGNFPVENSQEKKFRTFPSIFQKFSDLSLKFEFQRSKVEHLQVKTSSRSALVVQRPVRGEAVPSSSTQLLQVRLPAWWPLPHVFPLL